MPDSVPNYLTIDPTTGAVGADFTGRIHAQGLDLDLTGTLANFDPTKSVDWQRDNGDRPTRLRAIGDPDPLAAANTKLILETTEDTGLAQIEIARLKATTEPFKGYTVKASALAPGGTIQQALIIDDQGRSDFMRSARPTASAALPLINPPWSQFATPWGPAFWRQQANGLVTLYGLIQSTGAFGLPLNICGGLPTPKDINGNAQNVLFGCYTSTNNIARVDIQANGVMLMNTGGAAPTAAGWWFNLNGISYYA